MNGMIHWYKISQTKLCFIYIQKICSDYTYDKKNTFGSENDILDIRYFKCNLNFSFIKHDLKPFLFKNLFSGVAKIGVDFQRYS